jgi:hypothetical protein
MRARSPAAATLRRLFSSRWTGVFRMPSRASAHRAAWLSALRGAHGMAGNALCGVFRPPPRVCAGARGGRIRRARAADRGRLEGTRAAATGRLGGGGRRRDVAATGIGLPRVRPRRSGPAPAPRAPRRRAARAQPGFELGSRRRAAARPGPRFAEAARADTARAAPKRRLGLRGGRARAGLRDRHRRRLHDRSHGQCGRVRAAERRCPKGRNRDVRPDDSHQLRRRLRRRHQDARVPRASVCGRRPRTLEGSP